MNNYLKSKKIGSPIHFYFENRYHVDFVKKYCKIFEFINETLFHETIFNQFVDTSNLRLYIRT